MKKTLRWIAVIPAFFVSHVVANLLQTLFAAEWMQVDALEYLRSNPDIGPYPIRGSLFVIIDREILRCSFCLKSHDDVEYLIAGPTVYICDDCVVRFEKVSNEYPF
jgi:hypothetical protein